MNHRYSIGGDSHIELDSIRAGSYCLRQRLDCVFGSVRAISPVTNYRTSFGVEQNVHRQKNNGAAPRGRRPV